RRFPYKPYATDLAACLTTYTENYMASGDNPTTFIVVGDARNNYNDPNLNAFSEIERRARKVVWMNPEYPNQWGSGDSDMQRYLPLCDEVYQVRNLKQLTEAIDQMLA
ncbi:MAG: VWA domain-containing protein, partial [Anaerolineae bacterium]